MTEPSEFELVKARAMETRDKYLAGLITNKEARVELKKYIKLYNAKAKEIAAKYNRKPKNIHVAEFLKKKYY